MVSCSKCAFNWPAVIFQASNAVYGGIVYVSAVNTDQMPCKRSSMLQELTLLSEWGRPLSRTLKRAVRSLILSQVRSLPGSLDFQAITVSSENSGNNKEKQCQNIGCQGLPERPSSQRPSQSIAEGPLWTFWRADRSSPSSSTTKFIWIFCGGARML